jgi:glycosyl transferase family 25
MTINFSEKLSQPPLGVDAVYVLSVRKFHDRIFHIEQELKKHDIDFEFIFEHDVEQLDPKVLENTFHPNTTLGLAHQSLVLKHITAWQRCLQNNYKNILVFEDDVVLDLYFKQKLSTILAFIQGYPPSYLIFLGGASAKVPSSFFLEKAPIFMHPIDTAEGYVTDNLAVQRRLAWLEKNQVNLPADHLIKWIDQSVNISQYWATLPLVQQGSLFGLFKSSLDNKRKQRINFFTFCRYHFQIVRRKILSSLFVRCIAKIKSFII